MPSGLCWEDVGCVVGETIAGSMLKSLQTNGRMWTEIIRLQPPQVTENEERGWHSCKLFGDITAVSLIHCMLTTRKIAFKNAP